MKTNKAKLSKAAQGAEASDKVKALAGKKDEKPQPKLVHVGKLQITVEHFNNGKSRVTSEAQGLSYAEQIGLAEYAIAVARLNLNKALV